MPRVLTALAAALLISATVSAQEGAPSGPPPTPVRVANATEESLAPRKRVFGELRASKRSTVAAEEGGIVREVLVREGELAQEGAVLVRLDDARVKLEIAANAAALDAAQATVGEREATVGREERDLELLRKAQSQGGTNPREMSDAESDLAVARAQLAQARAAVKVIEQQGALLAKGAADLEVSAPYAGVVTARHVDVGAWVSDGGALVDFVATRALEAWFEVPQEFLAPAMAMVAESAKGLQRAVPIEIESATGAEVIAVGIRVVPEIDPRSRTFRTVLRVMDGDASDAAGGGRALAPGLALTAFVPAGAAVPRVVIPKDAVVRGDAGAFVFAVRGGVAVPVAVRIAFPLGDRVALEPGSLEAGAQVVTEGNERLMPMTPVAPIAGSEGAK